VLFLRALALQVEGTKQVPTSRRRLIQLATSRAHTRNQWTRLRSSQASLACRAPTATPALVRDLTPVLGSEAP
jgi:hypothetical protein